MNSNPLIYLYLLCAVVTFLHTATGVLAFIVFGAIHFIAWTEHKFFKQ